MGKKNENVCFMDWSSGGTANQSKFRIIFRMGSVGLDRSAVCSIEYRLPLLNRQ